MSNIAAVVITLNEERNIARCIDSLNEVVDEIIVVDAFSKDQTKSICESKGVTFIQREWEGYSKAKNFANSNANSKYILSVDADEALSSQLKASIKEAKKQGLTGVYEMNRLTNYCGKWVKHCGWYPDKKIRLFPKEGTRWVGDFVHEQLNFGSQYEVHFLEGDLLHYSYYTVEEHKARIEKYTDLGAKKLLAKGNKGGVLKGFVKAVSRFIQMYFFKGGWLDGTAGLTICKLSASAVYKRYVKLNKLAKA